MNMDDTLITKMVQQENDELRDATGQEQGVPTYTPVAFTSRGRVD